MGSLQGQTDIVPGVALARPNGKVEKAGVARLGDLADGMDQSRAKGQPIGQTTNEITLAQMNGRMGLARRDVVGAIPVQKSLLDARDIAAARELMSIPEALSPSR
jgi:hypothetical protein